MSQCQVFTSVLHLKCCPPSFIRTICLIVNKLGTEVSTSKRKIIIDLHVMWSISRPISSLETKHIPLTVLHSLYVKVTEHTRVFLQYGVSRDPLFLYMLWTYCIHLQENRFKLNQREICFLFKLTYSKVTEKCLVIELIGVYLPDI